MFTTVLIANRGEIAVRIIATLRRMNIATVAVYSTEDRGALHVRLADQAMHLPGDRAYLDPDLILDAARRAGAEAVHPGYGFLSENAALARACSAAGIKFVGPPPEAIELMGDKINAKNAVAAVGVPVVPGRDQAGLSDEELAAAARQIGFPVMLKPSAGGGGKGMRLVTEEADLVASVAAARREASGAFDDDNILVERYITNPRHIEMQVFADAHGHVVALGERECSLQRRHQKIVEEAPSPLLDTSARTAMADSAVAAAQACGYEGAGTVEFIVSDDRPGQYYFMEMNTRLQVEHPVTEMVLGADLVEWQMRVAAGEPHPWESHTSLSPAGHAIEARIYAEDPGRGFLPSTGTVLTLRTPPAEPHLRIDSALEEGTSVGTRYDPMLAKVVAWGPTRADAISRLSGALAATTVLGLSTNIGFVRRLIEHPDVVAGRLDTGLVERVAADLDPGPAPPHALAAAALAVRLLSARGRAAGDPWAMVDGWRLAGPAPFTTSWQSGPTQVTEVAVTADQVVVGGGPPVDGSAFLDDDSGLVAEVDGVSRTYLWARDGDVLWLSHRGDTWRLVQQRDTVDTTGGATSSDGRVTSPMPGTVLTLDVSEGDRVLAGTALMTVEAMKMEHVIRAPNDGVVGPILAHPGDSVRLDQPLMILEQPEGE